MSDSDVMPLMMKGLERESPKVHPKSGQSPSFVGSILIILKVVQSSHKTVCGRMARVT